MAPKKKEEGPSLVARFGRVKNNLKMGIVGLPNVGTRRDGTKHRYAVAARRPPFMHLCRQSH